LGVEYEHLHDYEASKQAYSQSSLSKNVLPEIVSKSVNLQKLRLGRLLLRHGNKTSPLHTSVVAESK
jgi:hypothetical protein